MWKDITGYEGLYQINEQGQVKRLSRWISGKNNSRRLLKEKPISPSKPNGKSKIYFMIHLMKDGKRSSYLVHRLVALAFIPNPNNKPEVNHIDGNSFNNHVSNLEWVTRSENIKHSFKPNLKQIKQIRKLIEDGLSDIEILKLM